MIIFHQKTLGSLIVPLFTRPTAAAEQKRFNSTVFSWVFKKRLLTSFFFQWSIV